MNKIYVYHAVTEKSMELGQKIIFDSSHHNGVFERIMTCKKILDNEPVSGKLADFIRSNMDNWVPCTYRELALEKVRLLEYPHAPSRLACLYTSKTLEEAINWARFFREIGRDVYSVVKLEVDGNVIARDACNCFDGTEDENYNLELARHYWHNDVTNERPAIEVLADGKLIVVDLIEDF